MRAERRAASMYWLNKYYNGGNSQLYAAIALLRSNGIMPGQQRCIEVPRKGLFEARTSQKLGA